MTTKLSAQALVEKVLQNHSLYENRNHRRLCVVRGGQSQIKAFVRSLLSKFSDKKIYYCSLQAPQDFFDNQGDIGDVHRFNRKNAKNALGTECDKVIFDGMSGIDPDLFGAISGSLKAGGIFWLLLPSTFPDGIDKQYLAPYLPYGWQTREESYFLKRVGRIIEFDSTVSSFDLTDGQFLVKDDNVVTQTLASGASINSIKLELTGDQLAAGEMINKVATGRNRRPLVLTADRGRGKTYLLGAMAKKLQAYSATRIIITAPLKHNVMPAFSAASEGKEFTDLETSEKTPVRYCFNSGGSLTFMPVDELLRSVDDCDLLLVDEASAIPLFLLEKILTKFGRVVFSSTIHGYEGHGRGFAIAFPKLLNRLTPGWKQTHMTMPVRWGVEDPLEKAVNRLLLLDADIEPLEEFPLINSEHETIKQIEARELLENEELLSQCFGLLVHAHYQTSPSDLMLLLDGPHIHLFASMVGNRVVAVCMIAREGGFDSGLDDDIHMGKRRPRGHMVPQTLSFHAGIKGASQLICVRIMRIATAPTLQNTGIATRLISYIRKFPLVNASDYLATSFSATPEVICFWKKNGFQLLRAGTSKDATSGVHSLVMGIPITDNAERLFSRLRLKNNYVLPDLLRTHYQNLPVELAYEIFLLHPFVPKSEIHEDCLVDLTSFIQGYRPFETCIALLSQWLYATDKSAIMTQAEDERYLLVATLIQRLELAEVVDQFGLTGRNQLLNKVKQALSKILV